MGIRRFQDRDGKDMSVGLLAIIGVASFYLLRKLGASKQSALFASSFTFLVMCVFPHAFFYDVLVWPVNEQRCAEEIVAHVPRAVLEHVMFGNNTAGFYDVMVKDGFMKSTHLDTVSTSTLHAVANALSQIVSENDSDLIRGQLLSTLKNHYGFNKIACTFVGPVRIAQVVSQHLQ